MQKGLAYLRVVFGLGILLILLWHANIIEVIQQFEGLDILWIQLTALMILLSTIIGAFNIYLFIGYDGEFTLRRFFPVYWVAWAVGLVVPGQVGDVASLTLMLRRYGINWTKLLGRALLDKLVSFLIMLLLALFGLILFFEIDFSGNLYSIIVGVSLLLILIAIYLYRQHLDNLLGRIMQGWRYKLYETLHELVHITKQYPSRVMLNITLTFLKIGLIGIAYWCMFKALGIDNLILWHVVLLVAISSMIAYIPISFNGLGTVEVAAIVLFGKVGLSEPAVLSAYMALRLIVLMLAWLPAALILTASRQQTG